FCASKLSAGCHRRRSTAGPGLAYSIAAHARTRRKAMNADNHQAPADPASTLAALWRLSGEDDSALALVRLLGREPALPSSFAVGTAAQASIAVSALAAAALHRQRGGMAQQIEVDMRHAAIEFRAEQYLR